MAATATKSVKAQARSRIAGCRLGVAVLCAGIGAGAVASPTYGQVSIRIAGEPTCSTCRVVLDSIATLASGDSVSFNWNTQVIATSDGYVAGPTYTLAQIAVFDRNGELTGTFGRPGRGPGELSSDLLLLRPGLGDTVHVLDYSRWLVFAPRTHEFVRSVNLGNQPTSFAIIDSGENRGDLLAAYPSRVATGHLHTVHLISAKTGEVIRSFDAPDPAELRDASDSSRRVWWHGGRIWSIARTRISIRSESLGGALTRWTRTDGWFPALSERQRGEPFIHRPTPQAWHVQPKAETIWIHATVADADWRPVARSIRDPAVTEALRTADMNTFYDSVIEIVDRETGNVLTRFRSDDVLGPVEGDSSLVLRKAMNADGEITIHILRVTLRN